ncbi:MAG: multiheme c-type cytochrome [Ignavibacteria bacterium]|nr:multiheme c-type cytochrome [Ignavibacteria bacterium]
MKKNLLLLLVTFLLLPAVVKAQNYAGSQACAMCHSTAHTDWKKSGHPYKIQKIENALPPTYPSGLSSQKTVGPEVSYLLVPGVPQPPKGYTWSQIGWVMGGYHSNARFIDTAGYVIWGDSAQFNLPTNKWVTYTQSAPGRTPYTYSCYKCHTTGASPTKTPAFDPYPGIEGSWAEAGVGCEGCHGPSSAHTTNPSNKPPKEGYNTCNNCHARDRGTSYAWNNLVEWLPATISGQATGFIRHREQGDMMLASKHHNAGMTCATCHAPHKGVYFELGGLKASGSCQNCHPNKEIQGHGLDKAECVDCHMPFAARNAVGLTKYVSEQSTHFWKILASPIDMKANLDTTVASGKFFIKRDANNMSGLTLDYTCLQCHVSQSVSWAAQYAVNIHQNGINSIYANTEIPTAYTLSQNFPNPFNPSTTIKFAIAKASNVKLNVYSVSGELVNTLINGELNAGWHDVKFDGSNLASGVYIYRIIAPEFNYSKKMVLTK